MAGNSQATPSMAQTDIDDPFVFIAFLTTGRARKRAERRPPCPAYRRLSGARVARQRCPILYTSPFCLAYFCPSKIGHLYFA